jgi:hypothetical protein
MAVIRKAVRHRPDLRVGFSGPSKSGKSFTALCIALGYNPVTDERTEPLVKGRIGLIDSEKNSENKGTSELYADLFDFDVIVLKKTHADYYTEAIQEFAKEKYELIIIDGLSPEWIGPDGCLQVVKRIAKTKYKGDSHRAWADVNEYHDRLILGDDRHFGIKNYPGHVFATIQAKTKYDRSEIVDNDGNKKTTITKLGMGPIQRAEIDYEFDTFFNLDHASITVHGDSRIQALEGQTFDKPGPAITDIFREWLAE